MTPSDIKQVRQLLGLSQKKLGESLGWSGAKQVSNLETGARPITEQTALAIECLLRRKLEVSMEREELEAKAKALCPASLWYELNDSLDATPDCELFKLISMLESLSHDRDPFS